LGREGGERSERGEGVRPQTSLKVNVDKVEDAVRDRRAANIGHATQLGTTVGRSPKAHGQKDADRGYPDLSREREPRRRLPISPDAFLALSLRSTYFAFGARIRLSASRV
jgi:hypothetical protein